MPSPDDWIPLPSKGSRPAILRRRWTPSDSAYLYRAADRWVAARRDEPLAPTLQRRWSRGPTLTLRSLRIPAVPDAETVTVGPSATRSADIVTAASETVTRLCIGCGKPLEGKRPQAKAHGVACRQRAYRRRKKQAAQAGSPVEEDRSIRLPATTAISSFG